MIMNMTQKKIKIEPRVKLNYNIYISLYIFTWSFYGFLLFIGKQTVFSQIRIAELIERENEVYHKLDPDPFDDRHPGTVIVIYLYCLIYDRAHSLI